MCHNMKTEKKIKPYNTPIAIVGIGCLFAKSRNLKGFLHLLMRGVDGITDPPESHKKLNDYYDPDPRKPDHIYCLRGGYLPGVDFDPTEFGIPPNAIEATDTSQLLGLVTAKQALADAGYGEHGKPFDREKTSVILGVTGTQELVIPLGARLGHPIWRRALQKAGIDGEQAEAVVDNIADAYVAWQENSFPGLLGNVVAGRIANRLDLGGTNCVVDAACASSMGAIHTSILELTAGRSDMVVTGGVDTINDAFMHMCFAKTQILSASGDIRPFSKDADGTVLGEGIGMLVLKRLDDAQNAGDRIYAVIKGIGSSSDGKAQSIYAPKPEGQVRALTRAYEHAGIAPATIDLVEAHGTGTRVGDQVEFESLCRVFTKDSADRNRRCALGSVKSNIGHTKASAGTAGIIKAALSVYHKMLPPTLKAGNIDPKLPLADSPFYLNRQLRPWLAPDKESPRRASVSAFGFGGSNFHAVIEEHHGAKSEPSWDGTVEIAAFCADNRKEVLNGLRQWEQAVLQDTNELSAICHRTRQSFDPAMAHRMLIVCLPEDSTDTLARRCRAAEALISGDDQASATRDEFVYYGKGNILGGIAFLFPGQGSQYIGMGRDMVCCFPQGLEALQNAEAAVAGRYPLSECIYPYEDRNAEELNQRLRNTAVAQPAIGAVSVAMLEALGYFNIKPDATCGHSYGELTALHAAGWIDQQTLWRLSEARGRLMDKAGKESGDSGGMLAVRAPLPELEALREQIDADVILANKNSPNQGILSGRKDAIAAADKACRDKGWKTIPLPVAAAFHSSLVSNARKPFEKIVATVDITPTQIPVMSNTLGDGYPRDAKKAAALLGGQLANPVDFIESIRKLYASGIRTFVEIGPKTVLTGLAADILSQQNDVRLLAVDSSSGRRFGLTDLALTLAELGALGYPVQFERWEQKPPEKRKARMTIQLSGTNYRPPKPANATAAKQCVEKKTDRPGDKAPAAHHLLAQNAAPAKTPATVQAKSPSAVPLQEPLPIQSRNTEKMNKPTIENVKSSLSVVQQGLTSLQALQTQTAQAHHKFLETQAEASRTLQQMIQSVQQLSGGVPIPRQEAATAAQPHPVMPQQQTGLQSNPLPSSARVISETLHEAPVARTIAPEMGKQEDREPASPPSSPPSADAGKGNQTGQVLLEVVSELTGYPVEMLGMDMDIESDLGIDSIKRVEILSAMEERMPELPKVTPDMMGSLKTLGQICEHMGSRPAAAPAADETPAHNEAKAKATTSPDAAPVLLEVVSELTGYPVEMLGMDMDIESDLGIDSIKRVEILSAMEERMPELPKVTPDMMGSLKTLGQICEHMGSRPAAAPAADETPAHNEAKAKATTSPDAAPVLLEVVSELTGYPVEMLGMDMDIESDLGIDSIKRVEILSAMEERMPELPKVTPDMMGSLKTLGQICAYLNGNSDASTAPRAEKQPEKKEPATPSNVSDDRPLERYVVACKPSEHTFKKERAMAKGHYVALVSEDRKFADAVKKALTKKKLSARILKSPADIPSDEPLGGMMILAPMEPLSAFEWARAAATPLQKNAEKTDAFLYCVSRMDGSFGFSGGKVDDPAQGALAGLAKTASLEWPQVACTAIDVDNTIDDIDAVAEAIVREIAYPDPQKPNEIGLTAETRTILKMKAAPLSSMGNIDLEPGDTVLVTGGARGVTAAAAMALARKTRCSLALLGRSPAPEQEPEWAVGIENEGELKKAIIQNRFSDTPPSPKAVESDYRALTANREIHKNIEMLSSIGVQVSYHSVDVRDKVAVRQLVETIKKNMGPVRAVIHGAGVLEDKLIADKTSEQFERVYSTKVSGLNALMDAVKAEDLRFLVLFSSVTARLGNTGQADYAMANEVLNKTARRFAATQPHCKVLSINWGPWDGGMVSPALKRAFNQRGVFLIPLEQGTRAMLAEMASADNDTVEVVLGGGFDAPATVLAEEEQTASAETDVPQLQPLNLSAKREIDLQALPVLKAHKLGGRPVVPFALITEWLAHSALHANPGLNLLGIDNLRLLKGIALDSGKKLIRLMAGKAKKNGSTYEVDVEIRNGMQGGREVVHSSAKAILANALPAPPAFTENGHFKIIKGTRSLDDLYNRVLFHGNDLRGIRKIIRVSEEGMTAELASAPMPENWMRDPLRTRWIADPLVLDCAFQMAIIWCYERIGLVSLPSYAASYRQYRNRFPSDGVSAVLEVHKTTERKMTGDFTFLDDTKQVIAKLFGYEAVMDKNLFDSFKKN